MDLSLEHATVVSLNEFEDENLLKVKPSRTRGEYCWTCTPSIILHAIKNYDIDHCTYLDADLFFFNSPSEDLANFLKSQNSVLITPHYYTSRYDQSERSGIYCVQFMPFKNDPKGLEVLNWWRNECLKWCYARCEEGKFGDQKYLDQWPELFDCIEISKNFGLGVAPWNVQQAQLYLDKEGLHYFIDENRKGKVIFYHFHSLKFYHNTLDPWLGFYALNQNIQTMIYSPYYISLSKNIKTFSLNKTSTNFNGMSEKNFNFKDILKEFRTYILRVLIYTEKI